MQIAIVTQAPAVNDGTGPDLPSLVRYLAGRGHELTVISADDGLSEVCPNVDLRRVAVPSSPVAKLADRFCVGTLRALSRIPTPDVLLTSSHSPVLPFAALLYKRASTEARSPRLVHLMTRIDPDASRAIGRPTTSHVASLLSSIIAVAPPEAECSRILLEHKVGYAVPAGHGGVLARKLWQLHDSAVHRDVIGRIARHVFEKIMSTDVVFPRLERMLLNGL